VIYFRQGKGHRDRTVPVQSQVAALVCAYLAATGRRMGARRPHFAAPRPRGRKPPRGASQPAPAAPPLDRCCLCGALRPRVR
jgi:integrase